MKTNTYHFDANTLVTFHIGRGGSFYNSGHLSFVDAGHGILDFIDNDNTYTTNRDLNGKFCKPYLADGNRNEIMDAVDYAKALSTGCGTIDYDGEYDTTMTYKLGDCGQEHADAILKSDASNCDSLIAAMVELGLIGDEYLEDLN